MSTTVAPATGAPGAASFVRAGSVVGPAMAFANVLQYALQLLASRRMAPSAFGGFGALLGLGVVGAVPMLVLQTVAARYVARMGADGPARRAEVARLTRSALYISFGVTLVGAALAPVIAAFMHVPVLAALCLGASLGPLALTGTAQGVLQGRERFRALAVMFVGVSFLRVIPPAMAVLLHPTITAGLVGVAIGSVAAATAAYVAVRSEQGATRAPHPAAFVGELRRAASGVLALLALGGTDLLLARHLLPGRGSGTYAVGSLVARGCFWGPQFVALLAVPRLASGDARVAGRAVGVVASLGAAEVTVCLVAPSSVVGLLLGPSYRGLTHVLALFALSGAALALLQLMLYVDIARGTDTSGRVLWGAVVVEVLLAMLLHPGEVRLITLAVLCIAGAALLVLPSTLSSAAKVRGS